jgi:hypothetical protein
MTYRIDIEDLNSRVNNYIKQHIIPVFNVTDLEEALIDFELTNQNESVAIEELRDILGVNNE